MWYGSGSLDFCVSHNWNTIAYYRYGNWQGSVNKGYEDSWKAFTNRFLNDSQYNHTGPSRHEGYKVKKCLICEKDIALHSSNNEFNAVMNHFINNHEGGTLGVATKFSYTKYNFSRFNGCGSPVEFGNGNVECGTTINYDAGYKETQKLTALGDYAYVSNNIVENNIEIPLVTSIGGCVWLDEQTGIKPAVEANGKIDEKEKKLEGIVVKLYKSGETQPIRTTKTDSEGKYLFENVICGNYIIRFEYDGINYEDTISGGDSNAFEISDARNTFNGRFQTITYGESKDGTKLEYNYLDGKSELITTNDGNVKSEFQMYAETGNKYYTTKVTNVNLGLVKRETDIALSTDVYDAEVRINGELTEYHYNNENSTIEIGEKQTNENVSYNLNLYASDYNYRIRQYVINSSFREAEYINGNDEINSNTGEELNVDVIYKVNLQNQSNKVSYVNAIQYKYDDKYEFHGQYTVDYVMQENLNGVIIYDDDITNDIENKTLIINLRTARDQNTGIKLEPGQTKTVYLVFSVKKNDKALNLGDFSNKAEIISYSTDEGLIDADSAPGNFMNKGQVEDDCDTAGGLKIQIAENAERKITGKVYDNDNSQNINKVIVQLIEQKTVNGRVYEYIWQETVSGTGKGLRLNATGTELEEYTYERADGQYEFKGYIPGNYIVRFIYGDGSTYTDFVYGDVNCDGLVNSNDYDKLYMYINENEELSDQGKINADMNNDGIINIKDWSSLDKYLTKSNFVYGDVNCDQLVNLNDWDMLYKYINGTEELSEQGKINADMNDDGKINIKDWSCLYNYLNLFYNGQDYKSVVDKNYKSEWYNSSSYTQGDSVARDNEARRLETMAYSVEIDASKGVLLKLLNNCTVDDLNETEKQILVSTYNNLYDPDITELTKNVIKELLTEEVFKNTWMCAETSKIKVPVDTATDTINNIGIPEGVNVSSSYNNINLGLELRPETKIELKKYITGFKLTAANGQTLVNATIDVNEYLNGTIDISNNVEGIKDSVTILGNVWQYEVTPTEINTIIEGANLEFEYTLVVKNTGETDYLGTELANKYNTSSTADYKTTLANKANTIKGYMRSGTYNNEIGKALGSSYYIGGVGEAKVLTEVTNIRDYINNDLTFISGKNVAGNDIAPPDDSSKVNHRILRDDYGLQTTTVNTITTEATGKMDNDGNVKIYKVILGKNPISSTGRLDFDTYIAEVMSYTNAAGRRATTSTPGNAEIIDSEKRTGKTHEIDEADTGRIQVSAATGEDGQTNYIIIASVIAGIALIAVGAFAVKKYVIK